MSEREQLEKAIAALEEQRAILGDGVVSAALAPLQARLADLQGSELQTASPEPAERLQEQRKWVTVLFADLVGFTSMSEQLDPEDVREVLNAYFPRWSARIEHYGGVVEKFIGDAVMAVFGLHTSQEDDGERAVRAALEMRAELNELNARLQAERGLRLSMRVGIHTGQVVISFLGERKGQDFVVIGDTVNLASRLQTSAPENGVLISSETYRLVRGVFNLQPLEPYAVKGRQDLVQTYLVLSAKRRAFRWEENTVAGMATPLVGRETELRSLQTALQEMLDTRSLRAVTLVGEAGVGKSRLLAEFNNWVELLPEVFLYFRTLASPYLQNQPYALLRDLFTYRFQIQDSDPPAVVRRKMETSLGEVLAEPEGGASHKTARLISRLVGLGDGGEAELDGLPSDPQQFRIQALEAIAAYFKAASERRPVVLICEDMHWADDSSLEALTFLDQALAGSRVLILILARPSLWERLPDWGMNGSQANGRFHTRLELHPLSRSDSQQLVTEILHKVADLPPELSARIIDSAEGNPFYIEELIKMLLEDGVIVRGDEAWQVQLDRLEAVRIPPTLTEVLQARFDSLPVEGRVLLQCAAVVGRVFWDQAVQFIATQKPALNLTLPQSETIFNRLRQREIIHQRDETTFEGTREFLFTHALLRDVTYESLLKRQRKIYHAHAARWLEEATRERQRAGEYAALIAEHYEQAEEPARAAAWHRQAGERAAAQYANQEAVHHLSRALVLAPKNDLAGRYALVSLRARIYDRQGNRTEQVRDLETLDALAEGLDDNTRRAEVLLRRANLAFVSGDYLPAITAAQAALSLAQAAGARQIEAEAHLWWGKALIWQANHEEAAVQIEKALAIARGAGNLNLEAECLWNQGIIGCNLGIIPPAVEALEQALSIYQKLGDRLGEGAVVGQIGVAYFNQGDLERARQYFEEAQVLARATGHQLRETILLGNLGVIAYEQGRYQEAEDLHFQAMQRYHNIQDKYGVASTLSNLGDIAREEGRFLEADQQYAEALKQSQEMGDRMLEGLVWGNLSLLRLYREDYPAAIQAARRALELTEALDIPLYRSYSLARLAHALRLDGSLQEAAARYQEALALQNSLGLDNNVLESLTGLAALDLEQGQLDKALAQVETILQGLETHDLHGTDEPAEVYLLCYRVLTAVQDGRASQLLARGQAFLRARAAQIGAPARQQAYLTATGARRQLMAKTQ